MSQLKRELRNLDRERIMLRESNNELKNLPLSYRIEKLFSICDESELVAILEGDISKLSRRTRMMLDDAGISPMELLNNNEFRYFMEKGVRKLNSRGRMAENNDR